MTQSQHSYEHFLSYTYPSINISLVTKTTVNNGTYDNPTFSLSISDESFNARAGRCSFAPVEVRQFRAGYVNTEGSAGSVR